MKWILVLIAWNGTLATVPDFNSKDECQSAGMAWRLEAKGVIPDPRHVCFASSFNITLPEVVGPGGFVDIGKGQQR